MAEEESEPGVPEWVVTFGDMMSLLLTFFIMLVSLSEMKQEEKYQALVESIKKQMGHSSSMDSMVPGPVKPRNSLVQQVANLARAKRKDLMRGGEKVEAPTGENRLVQIIRPGNQTAVGTLVYFDETSTVLSEPEKQKLRELSVKIIGKPQKIELRGHTSRRPITPNAEYSDHYELAFRRAMSVKDFLVKELGLNEQRIRINCAGQHEPRYSGIDPEQLKVNSRVDVFTLDEVAEALEGTDAERQERLIQMPNN